MKIEVKSQQTNLLRHYETAWQWRRRSEVVFTALRRLIMTSGTNILLDQ